MATVERVPLWNDKRDEHGPFDIIGDVHGCCDELEQLLEQLGYERLAVDGPSLWGEVSYRHPEGRKAFFVGDLVDRGPRVLDVVCIARNMVERGDALCVPGNHDMKLLRKLRGKNVQITHGLANSLAEIDALPDDVRKLFCKELADFLDGLVSHYVLDNGKLVVAHAGMKEEFQGRGSGKVREFALYGETTGETDEFGLPVRYNWAAEYRGPAMVAYGHTPVPEPEWLNRTVNVDKAGIVYTRTGRRFFNDAELESTFLDRLRAAMTASGFWDEFQTSWACLDCELMPWSAKAQELLRSQYAAVGSAGRASLPEAIGVLERAAGRMNGDNQSKTTAILDRLRSRRHSIEQFVAAYRQYCWSVESLSDLKLAPFHLLATEGKVHTDQNHIWHMEALAKVCQEDADLLLATDFKVIDLTDLESISAGIDWWMNLTGRGGEGMVVKPADWIVRGKKGLVQPAVKCRGKEYLRIIYSSDYDSEENLPRLRNRSLGRKQSLALREFALGLEALERFVRREPLQRVHECVFGVLALESEPVDPRL